MNLSNPSPDYLSITDSIALAYHKTPGKSPGVVFCGGFMSDMSGTKALAVEAFCQQHGHSFVRFDYRGHGESQGNFADGTIGAWRDDALAILDNLTTGPQILVGSSMGGWIATLAALARPDRVKGLVGIAVAPDFTEELLWQKSPQEQKDLLLREKKVQAPCSYKESPYVFTLQLIEEGRQHLLLGSEIPLQIPVRLLHGLSDPDVPWQYSLRFTEKLQTPDVQLHLIKDGDHRLMREQDLQMLTNNLHDLLTCNAL